MAKKNDSRPAKTRTKPGTSLVSIAGSRSRELKKIADDVEQGSVFEQGDVRLVAGRSYPMGDREVVADAAYYVGGSDAPRAARLGGADEVAWKDAATGYECIMLREPGGGYLCGFVGVEPDHPQYGFDHDAVPPELDIEVHGGLTYAAICADGPSPQAQLIHEVRRICHVAVGYAPVVNATDHHPGHQGAWWFGFDCNHVHDVVPSDRRDRERFLAPETGAVLRDEGYVFAQVVDLAAQLRAIADGEPKPPRTGAAPPSLGLDPKKAG